jgi:hypothetical protein
MTSTKWTARLLACAAGLSLMGAHADNLPMPRQALPKYAQECAACHMAYPPGLLPAASWRRIMGSLERHFGSDASLDEASVREIGGWLQANAATHGRALADGPDGPAQDRITRAAWFVRKHREIAAEVWRRPGVKSPANCLACHGGAERGDFEDDRVRIPK